MTKRDNIPWETLILLVLAFLFVAGVLMGLAGNW